MRTRANWAWLAALAVVVIGCAEERGLEEGCPPVDSVAVVNHAGELSAKPECVSVAAGKTLTLNLQPGKPPGSARTRARPGGPSWLDRENEVEGAIVIEVPEGAGSGGASCDADSCTYKYEIEVDGIGMLDPRVRVTN